jgi:TM2 domain-containing membrane protein YozV
MSQKVWVIEDSHEEQVLSNKISQKILSKLQQSSVKQRSPSLAYSLSIIIWGCGQFYNRQWKLGILFLLFMINYYSFMSIIFMYWERITSTFESMNLDCAKVVLIFWFFYISGLIVWLFNAWQAYFESVNTNARSFKGTKIPLLSVVCSFLIPGWGQLLNGQPKKGLLFHVFALLSLSTLPLILIIFLVWPSLEASRSRLIIEWIFSISVILSPFIFMVWIVNIFDAAKVSLDNTKKDPLLIRMKHATNRFRNNIQVYGKKNTVLPIIKRITLIILLMIFCVISYHSFPKKFYMQQLQNLGNRMSEQEMTVIPSIIKKLPNNISLGK